MSKLNLHKSVIVRAKAKPGKREELFAGLGDYMKYVREKEPETLVYVFHADDKDPDVFWIYEHYSSEDAMKSHQSSEAFKGLTPLMAMVEGSPVEHYVTPMVGILLGPKD